MRNYYQVLGVAADATEKQIKKAFRAKAFELHPDKNAEQAATELFREVQEAYETLVDPVKRSRYDHYLAMGLLELYTGSSTSPPAPPQESEYERRKREFIRQRKEQARQEAEEAERLIAKFYYYLRRVNRVTFLFALLLIIDRFLPTSLYQEPIEKGSILYDPQQRYQPAVDHRLMETANFSFSVSNEIWLNYQYGDSLRIAVTPIFHVVRFISLTNNQAKLTVEPTFNLYSFGMILPLLLLLLSYFPLRNPEHSDLLLYCGILACILAIVLFGIR